MPCIGQTAGDMRESVQLHFRQARSVFNGTATSRGDVRISHGDLVWQGRLGARGYRASDRVVICAAVRLKFAAVRAVLGGPGWGRGGGVIGRLGDMSRKT